MPDYLIPKIPSQLWFAFRNRADHEQWPIRSLLLQLIQDYADGKVGPTTEPPPTSDET